VILYPAIDLKHGRCVRLLRGAMDSAVVFNDDPADQARRFEADGFEWLHVVDLDGAVEGGSRNADAVVRILGATRSPVQLGGGVRSMSAIDAWLARGVTRVILGTAALTDPQLVRDAARAQPGRIVVGIDARAGRVAVDGWTNTSEVTAVELARRFEDAGVAALIVTDIARDGTLSGVGLETVGAVADAVSLPVIASGGVGSLDDLRAVKTRPGAPIAGAIVGRALYEGRFTAAEALAL
jgi:phosphoribosylformimino-5-aminoimidazole carboxamide ribotide isomerase